MNTNYLEQLTWLRGIAALLVVVSHSLQATYVDYTLSNSNLSSSIWSFANLGSFGVVLFFTLSGCTLYLSNATKVGKGNITRFYLKRFFRIWPAFLVALLAYFAFSFIFKTYYIEPQGYWVEKQFLASYSLFDLITYLTMTFNLIGELGLFNNAFWSLPVEFQYYLMFPLIIALVKRKHFAILFAITLGLYLLPRLNVFPETMRSFLTLAYSFIGGVFIGYVYELKKPQVKSSVAILLILTCFAFISAVENRLISLPDIIFISNRWNWYVFLSFICVGAALFTKVSVENKATKLLSHYGLISYSTYLYHNLVLGALCLIIIEMGLSPSLALTTVVLFSTVLASYYLADFSFKFVEKPFIAIGRRI